MRKAKCTARLYIPHDLNRKNIRDAPYRFHAVELCVLDPHKLAITPCKCVLRYRVKLLTFILALRHLYNAQIVKPVILTYWLEDKMVRPNLHVEGYNVSWPFRASRASRPHRRGENNRHTSRLLRLLESAWQHSFPF